MEVNSQIRRIESAFENQTRSTQGEDGNLNKADFLNLFMHQLANQDPLDPMDSSKMMTQMSQLGSMEQLQLLNSEVKTLNSKQSELSQYAALQLVGQNVTFANDALRLRDGVGLPVSFNLKGDSSNVAAKISDSQGLLVADVNLGQKMAGAHEFVWDGKNQKGELLLDGDYSVKFKAYDDKGNALVIDNEARQIVEGVKFVEGQPMLKVGDSFKPFNEVRLFTHSKDSLFRGVEPLPSFKNLKPEENNMAVTKSKGT